MATFGDISSSHIHMDIIMWLGLFTIYQILIILYRFFSICLKADKSCKHWGAVGLDVDNIILKKNYRFYYNK